jgi:UDP-N-acetylglucosamine/UDP-N-acetyl-alpha-D-glucosaminouronate 4-epimerase
MPVSGAGGNQLSYPSDADRAILPDSRAHLSMSTNSQAQGRLVLVTGGAGFIGSHLVDALVAAGHRVRVIENFASGTREQLNHAAELVEGDIRVGSSIANAFEGVDTVFHVAALPRIPLSIAKPVETHMTNVVGTLNVLIAARDHKVRRVVYSGSSSVYGEQAKIPLVETMTPNPLNPYALQKYVSEEYTRMFHRLFGMQTLTLRYFGVYGPRMPSEGSYVLAVAAFLKARREGRPLDIFGDGEQTRDFTHVSDVVSANMLAMDCEIADGRAINIGRGQNVSVNRIAAMIGGPTVHHAGRPGDMRDTLADCTQAERVLGWRPRVSIEEGIADLLKEQGVPH